MEWDDIYQLIKCQREAELVNLFEQQLIKIGIKSFGYFQFNAQHPSELNVISTYPQQWVDEYIAKNYLQLDTTIPLSVVSNSPVPWSYAKQCSNGKAQFGFWQQVKAHKLNAGASIPLSNNKLQIAGLGCAIDNEAETKWLEQYGKQLEITSTVFHQQLCALKSCPDVAIQQLKLTHREIECGKWLSNGCTYNEVGKKLNISERTARFHLENLKLKLGAKNKEQVISKLVAHQIITP
ncbi:autoinducer binding domain-containing protein [Thalassotalea euphylliae]|uniref:HTH luxR-type domain-containing protein n=1 Tax=Thalassotalea euphylliae TaxID=1655234 RepID=A0A3E0UBV1_9GAMM|nr:autoinducer binding domain-containing protein [Thalassotalea euphylliae]REL34320.1 hypothetical protein DXX92_02565 [Thalassotalea euphylliae]